ncbi:putative membrane protein YczE [Kineosphaera limosa]|nr:putative membrane protein YczE [Kineosphaera limosa]
MTTSSRGARGDSDSRRRTRAAARAGRPALLPLSPLAQLRAGRMPRRLLQLFVGLSLYGVSMAMLLRSTLGLDPWDVFHDGLTGHVSLSFGQVVIVASFAVLLLWIPLRQWPGLGTVANAVWIGVVTDLTLSVLVAPENLTARGALLGAGVVLNGLAGALYIGAQLGPGPRDGLMTGLHRRTGISLRVVRTALELTVLAFGWLLGGVVGLGTVLYALSIGPLVQFFLPLVTVRLELPPTARGTESERATPVLRAAPVAREAERCR